MSDADETPEAPAEPVKVKQVAISAGLVSAALAAAVAFTVAGPLGVGIAAAGVAGTGYTVHRIRNPRKGTLLHSLLTRPRSSKTSKGTLTWPFTGNQQKRALTRAGRASGHSSRSKLPSLTSTRARRSAALTGRSASAKTGGTKRGPGTTAGRRSSTTTSAGRTKPNHAVSGLSRRSGTRPGGKPSTPTRTPSKLSRSTLSPAKQRSATSGRGSGRSILPKTSSGRGSLTRRGPLSLGRKSSGTGGTSARRSSLGRRGRPTSPTRGRFSTTGRGRGRWNPFLGTRGGQSLGRRSTDTRRTRRANRLGGTLGSSGRRSGPIGRLRHRVTPDRNRNTSPNRTRLRPRPYARRTTGQLLRTSLRVPRRQRGTYGSRNGWRPFVLPTQRQAKRARRTLRLRSGVWSRRGIVWLAKTPARHWDRLWERLPKAPLPLTHYTERAGMKTPSGPKATTPPTTPARPAAPVSPAAVRDINLIPIKQNGNVIYVSSPNDLIRDAFQQMASFHPGSAAEVEAWVADLGDTLNDVGRSFGVLADQMRDGMPFAAPFADSVSEIGVAIAATSGLAQSSHATMRAAHEADFKRFEDPRPDEGMWNPERNR